MYLLPFVIPGCVLVDCAIVDVEVIILAVVVFAVDELCVAVSKGKVIKLQISALRLVCFTCITDILYSQIDIIYSIVSKDTTFGHYPQCLSLEMIVDVMKENRRHQPLLI